MQVSISKSGAKSPEGINVQVENEADAVVLRKYLRPEITMATTEVKTWPWPPRVPRGPDKNPRSKKEKRQDSQVGAPSSASFATGSDGKEQ